MASGTASCDAGMKVAGGGVKIGNLAAGYVIDDYPEGSTGWTARVAADTGSSTFTVYAICVPAS